MLEMDNDTIEESVNCFLCFLVSFQDYCSLNSSFWGKFGPTSKEVHFVYGTFLMIIGVAGVVGNSLVLFVFSRYRRLKGPFSAFIINLAISDLCTACLHFMPAFSSFQNQWAFGHSGCVFYAFGVGHFGLLSIVILSVIAVERYMVLTTKPFSGTWKITECGARKVCIGAWLYVFCLTLPPLFGWSCYIPEGFMTSCSWDYMSRTMSNRAFYLYLLMFGFILPVAVITYCYVFILHVVLAHGKEMSNLKTTGRKFCDGNNTFQLKMCDEVNHFGFTQVQMASVVYNPLIYGLSHPSFKSLMKQYMSSCTSFNMTTRGASMSRCQSQRGYKGDVLSSPPDMGHAHDRMFRTRGFRKLHHRDFNSEPDQRSMAVLLSETGSSVLPGRYRVTSPPHTSMHHMHEEDMSMSSHVMRTSNDYSRRATILESSSHTMLHRNQSQTSFKIKFSRSGGQEESVTLYSSGRIRTSEELTLQNLRHQKISNRGSFRKSSMRDAMRK
ncbi:melanopsin-like [Diaphorina citri]|uniref:Melanopsin-like n=1 Tax=Diaphorina citri TaxID=121845 RepID=A0A3Q0ITD1_DIACI|nr:melanopsin-like [Diaphorina citri]